MYDVAWANVAAQLARPPVRLQKRMLSSPAIVSRCSVGVDGSRSIPGSSGVRLLCTTVGRTPCSNVSTRGKCKRTL